MSIMRGNAKTRTRPSRREGRVRDTPHITYFFFLNAVSDIALEYTFS